MRHDTAVLVSMGYKTLGKVTLTMCLSLLLDKTEMMTEPLHWVVVTTKCSEILAANYYCNGFKF